MDSASRSHRLVDWFVLSTWGSQGRYRSGKKDGDGVYNFLNQDVYEGQFASDRMDGHGVYAFSHEGR